MNGMCPRCGVGRQYDRWRAVVEGREPRTNAYSECNLSGEAALNDASLWGTVLSRDDGAWYCIECGCVFDDEGAISQINEILGEDHEDSIYDGKASGQTLAWRDIDRIGRRW